MNKPNENLHTAQKIQFDIQRNQTPTVAIFRGQTPLFTSVSKKTAVDTLQKPTSHSQLNRFDEFDKLRFSDDKFKSTTIYAQSRQRQNQLYHNLPAFTEKRPTTISGQSVSTASMIQIENQSEANDIHILTPIVEKPTLTDTKNQAKLRQSLLRILPKEKKLVHWFEKDPNYKPRFNAVFNKHSSQKLIQLEDPLLIKKKTSQKYEIYQRKKQKEAKTALEFRSKNSIVIKYYDKVCDPRSIDFCKGILHKVDNMIAETKSIPFSVATHGADNGLKEKVPTIYKEEINSESIDAAKQMVQQIKNRAQLAGHFQEEISAQTKDMRKQKVLKKMKSAFEMLKSMNFVPDGNLDQDIIDQKDYLFYAVKQNKYKEVLQMIDREPMLLNLLDQNLMTPLHWAVKRNYISLVDALLKRGAKRNPQDILGRTPLHFAAKQNFYEMTKLLLRNKADLNIKNKKQLTPIDIATSEEIVNLMTKARRFDVIAKMSFGGPSKALLEAQHRLFKMAGEESD